MLEACNADPRYVIEMGEWHSPSEGDDGEPVCCVCLAGAVIAKRLGVLPSHCTAPGDFGWKVKGKLVALDHFRMGEVFNGLSRLDPYFHGDRYTGPVEYDLGEAEASLDEFCRRMRRMASELRKEGL